MAGDQYVDWLDSNGLLELGVERGPGPIDWEAEEELDILPVDRGRFLPQPYGEDLEGWLDSEAVERILSAEPDGEWEDSDAADFDRCAWYSPIHFHGKGWGITIRSDCLIERAVRIRGYLGPVRASRLLAHQLAQASFDMVFQHELFHHKVESLSVRLEVLGGRSVYSPYFRSVYRPLFLTDDCFEEGLANASASRWISTNGSKTVGRTVRDASLAYLANRFPRDLPGYRMAHHFTAPASFKEAQDTLAAQVFEGSLTPRRPPGEISLATHIVRPLFTKLSNIWVVFRPSSVPSVPTGTFPYATPSTAEMQKLLREHGYKQVPGGKGSHVKMARADYPMVVLPGNRKHLSPGVTKQALDSIGLRLKDLR